MKNLVTNEKVRFYQNEESTFNKNISISTYIAEFDFENAERLIATLSNEDIDASIKSCKTLLTKQRRLSDSQKLTLQTKLQMLQFERNLRKNIDVG